MRIERLEIVGFKSFAEPVAVEFGRGATAVVGPNGCGKSNIADAVFWVLGEQKASTIRARGKELIFSGSREREPLAVAEVRLHLSGVRRPAPSPPAGNGAAGGEAVGGEPEADAGQGPAGAGEADAAPESEASPAAAAGNGVGNGAAAPLRDGSEEHELVVGRRMDATGESVYEMDGKRCRRKDIRRLFASTGLGENSYALIEQGRANDVLARKPADLRLLVEEAVGLGDYRQNRHETELNLQAARKALARVAERLGELDRAIRVARRDSRVARRVREASERARLLEIAEEAARREALLARIQGSAGPRQALDAERGRRSGSLRAFERFVEEIRERAAGTEVELREATRQIGELGARRATAAAVLEEGKRAAAARAERVSRLEAEAAALERRLDEVEAERQESALRAGEFPARIEELNRDAERLAGIRDDAAAAERETQSAVWELRREADRLRAGVGAIRLSRGQYAAQRERLAAAGLGLAGTRRELEARLDQATRAQSEGAGWVRSGREEAARLGEEAGEAERAWRAAVEAAGAARDEEARAERELAALSGRLRSLRELVGSREQLGASASQIAEAAARRGLPVGPAVGELVEVEAGYELAAERLLGVHRLRVAGVADLEALVEELGGEEAGPSEVLVGELLDACAPPEADEAAAGEENRLRDHLSVGDPGLVPIVPEAVVTSDLTEALGAFLRAPGVYVTRGGVSVEPPGIVRFGRGGPGDGFLATRREVAELDEAEKEQTARRTRLAEARTAAEEVAERAAAALEARREAHRQAENRVERLRLEATRQEDGVRHLGARLEELDAQAAGHTEDVQQNEEDDRRATGQLEADEARLENAAEELGRREEAHAAARREHQAREQEWREADRALTRQSAVADEVAGRARELERQVAEDRRRLDRVRAERAAADREEETWGSRREEAAAERGAVDAAIRGWEEKDRVLTGIAGELRERLDSALEAARQRDAELRAVEARLQEVRSEAQEAQGLLRELESEFERRHGGPLEREAAALPSELRGRPREEIAGELAGVRERIAALGPVNEIAQARLVELEAERREPEAHLRDVEEGISDGMKAIRRQDREARRIFGEGFEAVSDGFDEAFRQLFGGGRATLRLVAPPEPRESDGAMGEAATGEAGGAPSGEGAEEPSGADAASGEDGAAAWEEDLASEAGAGLGLDLPADTHLGVEIRAQPPGKKLQSVRLLSGGEKAMTALAFLIALFRYRPAPFCLLDEVDAPLDDANIQRFAAMLDELKRDSQLVVITHNRLTMEACEHLYGVTMEEPGVSRLISVQLGDDLESWIAGAGGDTPEALAGVSPDPEIAA